MGKSIIPTLLDLLNGDNPTLRIRAVHILGDLKDKSVVPTLIEAAKPEMKLDFDSRIIARSVVTALIEINDKRTVPALIKNLDNIDPNLVRDVADALAVIGDKSAIPALAEAYDNSSVFRKRFARVFIASALAALGDKRGITYLFNELHKTEHYRRLVAVVSLGKYGDKSIIPQLEKIMKEDYSYQIREAAKEAIKSIMERNN